MICQCCITKAGAKGQDLNLALVILQIYRSIKLHPVICSKASQPPRPSTLRGLRALFGFKGRKTL